jgi:hypothetical protein
MKIGYKITLWLLSLTEKLCKRYGIPSRSVVYHYTHHKPVVLRCKKIVPRDYVHSEQWMINYMREEMARELHPYIDVKATEDLYSQQIELEALITIYQRDNE